MISPRVVLPALVLLLILVAILAQWPARHGIGRLSAAGLDLGGIQGTVWSGSAARGSFRGLRLGTVRWTVDPKALLGLALRADIQIDGPDLTATGTARRSFNGAIELHGVQARIPAAWLQGIINEPFLELDGDLWMELDRARIGADGRLVLLEGESRWRAARLGGRLAADLGTLRVTWRTESPGVILGLLADGGGALELSGTVTVSMDHYEIDARLGARGDAVPLRQALELFGRPDAAGRVQLRIGGPMLALGGA